MYYAAKLIQAAGLTMVLIGFILSFPKLMSFKLFMFGVAIFSSGWLLQRLLLKN